MTSSTPSKSNRPIVAAVVGLLLIAVVVFMRPSGPNVPKIDVKGKTMGTWYNVKYLAPEEGVDQGEIEREIESCLENVNAAMSTWREDSALSRFNQHESSFPFPAGTELTTIFALAREISEASGGAFDITVGPIVNAYGFGPDPEPTTFPSDDQIAGLRKCVGYQLVEIDVEKGHLTKKHPDVYCDLSAIAKGYGVDQVAELLERQGIMNYMVEIGGEVRTRGVNDNGRPWRIGVERPDEGGRTVLTAIDLVDKAMATSGDYRNFIERGGVRVSHTIDPRTGRPIKHGLASVSVIHDHCAEADAWATALNVLGPDEGFELAERLGLAALFLIRGEEATIEKRATSAYEAMTQMK